MSVRRSIAQFFEAAIASALDYGIVSEAEILGEVGIPTLVEAMEKPIRARLLAACLRADAVTPELLVRTIGIEELSESVPRPALWRVVAIAGARASNTSPEMPLAKTAERAVHGEGNGARRAASLADEAARKPNRRVRGAGATSRRNSDPPPPAEELLFVSSRQRSSARAATEPSMPPDSESDIDEIEVIDETEVELPVPKP